MHAVALAVSVVLSTAAPAQGADPFTAYAQRVEAGLQEARPDAMTIDPDALVRRVVADVPAPERLRNEFVTGMKRSLKDQAFGKQLAAAIGEEGSAKLLRVVHEGKTSARALYRILGTNGVNYVDAYLERGARGGVRVVDAYLYLSGETLSQTMRRIYLLTVSEADMGVLDRLSGKEQLLLKNAPALQAILKAQQEKRHRDVIATYEKLPAPLKKERIFLIGRFNAAAALGDDALYQRAIEDWEAALPDDPSLDLVSIDGHVLRKQHDQALARVEKLDARVHDPYLQLMRGSILLEKGDRAGAKARLRAAIAGEPTMTQAYWTAIGLSLQDKEWRSTADLLTAVERDAGVPLANLEQVDEFADFVKSKEYRAWKQGRAKQGK